jgi:hypothetical protein
MAEAAYKNEDKKIVPNIGDIVNGPGEVRAIVIAVEGASVTLLKICDDGTVGSAPRWIHKCPAI